jgi:toxin-antitoxin system PIN domain toxin
MNRWLLDVNVLLALLWPPHEDHVAAQTWFAKTGRRAWATNPITQLGVMRLLTNSSVTRGAVSAANAIEVVAEAMQHEGHEFWPLQNQLTGLKSISGKLLGHRQWTDAVLLLQAVERSGTFVTFDSGVSQLAGRELKGHLLLLKRS